jgi:zinc D-Ala-D-Ala dipeptidase
MEEIIEEPEEVLEEEIVIPEIELKIIEAGLVNVQEMDSSIVVDLRYSGTNNFMGIDVYEGLKNAYLQPDVAEKLLIAQHLLKSKYPNYNLMVLDAVRPLKIQQKMWDMTEIPINEKTKYISNPKNGSIHNYGAAVDLTIADEYGEELDMGTPYDFFGELAHPSREAEMIQKGLLTEQQVNNRKLLREVMKKAGFFNIQTEWWHFNSCTRAVAKERYSLIE